jgi:TrmH family RNA methyltransferase
MLSKSDQKLIRSLHKKKGRAETGKTLIEGQKLVDELREFVDFDFTDIDTDDYKKLVTTETPQMMAAVARIPEWGSDDVKASKTIIVLDHIQDPGNVGTLFRLALAFDATVITINSVDTFSPKVIRSSAGAVFRVPHIAATHEAAAAFLPSRKTVRLEKRDGATPLSQFDTTGDIAIIAGNEGKGVSEQLPGDSIYIEHSDALESLNVAAATAIVLYKVYNG